MASTLGMFTTSAYVAADPWSKIEGDDKSKWVARFKVLHNPYGKNKDGNEYPPIAINFVCFGAQAKTVSQFVRKGSKPTVVAMLKSIENARKDGELIKDKNGNLIINVEAEVINGGLDLGARTDGGSSNGSSSNGNGEVATETGSLAAAPF